MEKKKKRKKNKNKRVLSVTIDADLYDKIDMICQIQNDTRSGFVERALLEAVVVKEEILSDMQNPVNHVIYDILSKTPDKLIHMATKLIGENLTDEDLKRIRKNSPLLNKLESSRKKQKTH